MRINVYAEELTREACFLTKEVEGRRFYGIRLYLKSPRDLHHTPTDDDRSAITFWVPWYAGENHHEELRDTFFQLSAAASAAHQDDLSQTDQKQAVSG